MLQWMIVFQLVMSAPTTTPQTGGFLVAGNPPLTPIPPQATLLIEADLNADANGAFVVAPAGDDGRFDLIVHMSGLETPAGPPYAVRAVQFFVEFVVTPDEGQDAPFVVLGFDPGGPGEAEAGDASPMQFEIATLLEPPGDSSQTWTIGYAVGVAPEFPMATEDCQVATISLQAVAPGTMELWFRAPDVLPTTMLADDNGLALTSPDLILVPADPAQPIRIRFDETATQDSQTQPPDTDPPGDQSVGPNSSEDSLDATNNPGISAGDQSGPDALSLEDACGDGTCGIIPPACVPLLMLGRLRCRRNRPARE